MGRALGKTYDAVVIGAGPNGLVAANQLLDAGWSVLVLEAQPTVGGAVRSDRAVHPDFVHDTFSAFYPLAATSPTIRSFGLEEYGLCWSHAPAVLGHPLPDGSWALLHRDRQVTAGLMDERHPGDGEAWLRPVRGVGPHRRGTGRRPAHAVPARTPLARAARPGCPARAELDFVRTLLAPATALGTQPLRGRRTRGSCSPATPGTPTSPWTRSARG